MASSAVEEALSNPAGIAIRQIPAEERPRERLIRHGSGVLSNAELLAIIIGSGTRGASALQLGQELITLFGGVKGIAQATLQELRAVRGLGPAKALQVKAACQLGINAMGEAGEVKAPIRTPAQAFGQVKGFLSQASEERLVAVLKDTKGCSIAVETVAIGTLSDILVHPREVFYPAVRHKAASLILAHNHPSGDLTPSKEDITLTESIVRAGVLMDLPVDDHLIVAGESFLSLRERMPQLFRHLDN